MIAVEQKQYEQSLIAASQYSKFIVAYDFVTILLIIAVGLGGISEIAKNKLLGYPYIESQIELNKLNNYLSEADYKIEQESELKKKLIDSIVYFQSPRKSEK